MPPEAPIPASPPGEAPSVIQTIKPFVAFQPGNVPPSQAVYLQLNDFIFIRHFSNVNGLTVNINYRFLTPQGEIKEGSLPIFPAAGVAPVIPLPMSEVWVLSITAFMVTAAVAGSWVYIQIGMGRGATNFTTSNQGMLWEGYLYAAGITGWPGIPSKENWDGAGMPRVIVGTVPAAGADINEVVPGFRRWQLLSLRATLTTSVTVANRIPAIQLDDGVNVFYLLPTSVGQAASLAQTYLYVPSLNFLNNGSGAQLNPLPPLIALKGSFHIRTTTTSIQAGDQWTAPIYEVLEWGSIDA